MLLENSFLSSLLRRSALGPTTCVSTRQLAAIKLKQCVQRYNIFIGKAQENFVMSNQI